MSAEKSPPVTNLNRKSVQNSTLPDLAVSKLNIYCSVKLFALILSNLT